MTYTTLKQMLMVVIQSQHMDEDHKTIIANITWNPDGWRNTRKFYINPHAGHRYVRKYPGHESLNYYFDKPFDTNEDIYGYVQWAKTPKNLADGAVMIFYSTDIEHAGHKGKIIGIYGNVKLVDPVKRIPYEGFEKDELLSNITAKRNLSFLFPIYLDAKKYSQNGKRLVPQVGYTYRNISFAEQVVVDEINVLKQGGIRIEEYNKLKDIYFFITGKKYADTQDIQDEQEQKELDSIESTRSIKEIINELKQVTPQTPELVETHGKIYKRDNKSVVDIKIVRGKKCQICGTFILTKDNKHYVEAAHIKPKRDKGPETFDNIIVLCPNHHKEFDYGATVIISQDEENITFEMNGISYTVRLALD